MRIAQLAPIWKTVPPKKYGGTELVVSELTEELVRQGHQVTLFACGGSSTTGKLVEVIQKPMYDLAGGFGWKTIQPYMFLEFAELIKHLKDFDIIHNHIDDFYPLVFAPLIDIPLVTTWHSSTRPNFPFLAERFKDNFFVSISDAQRQLAPYLNYVQTIYHGLPIKRYEFANDSRNDFLFFLGSLTAEKGVDLAVKAASEMGEKLIIAGERRKADEEFLREKVLPYVDGEKIKLLGEISFQEKIHYYSQAKALLFPSQWHEAFGLVMIEALACGTPVIAYNHGSVSEVIENNKTGFVVDNFSDFKQSISQIASISRSDCRLAAETRFDVKIMADNYVKLYQQLIKNNRSAVR